MTQLDLPRADAFTRIALGHVTRPFPSLPQLVMEGPQDLALPQAIHPIFYGSLDWHSCVHGYWLLARLLRRFPTLAARAEIEALFARHITLENARCEAAYFAPPIRRGFERPYGWAWLLKLAAELHDHPVLSAYAEALRPLSDRLAGMLAAFLPLATYPVRVGTHPNSAFALLLSLDYAAVTADTALADLIRATALGWYGEDRVCQAWEPGGDEFLSPSLTEAALMTRLLDAGAFARWFAAFLPDLAEGAPATLFTPATVSNRADGKIAHLDGLNLSRVWAWRLILGALPATTPGRARIEAALSAHLDASLPHVSGDYMGEHWLATYATLALEGA